MKTDLRPRRLDDKNVDNMTTKEIARVRRMLNLTLALEETVTVKIDQTSIVIQTGDG